MGVGAWARFSAAPRHSWLGCWGVSVFVCALRLYPATPCWGVRCGCWCFSCVSAAARHCLLGCSGVCVCLCARSVCTLPLLAVVCGVGVSPWALVLAARRQCWLGVRMCVWLCVHVACTRWLFVGVCGVGVCGWPRVLAAPRHSWLGCSGVCVFLCAPLLAHRHSWLGSAVWVCVLGLGFPLGPATRGWGVLSVGWVSPGTCCSALCPFGLCALPGFATPCGRCCLAPVRVPWLWPAACLPGVPRGPALVRRASCGPVALGALVGFPEAVVPFPTPGPCAPGSTGLLCGTCGGRPRTGLFVRARGRCRGSGGGLAPRCTRSASPSGVGLGLRALRWFACVYPVTDVSGFPYSPSCDGGLIPLHSGGFVWRPTPPLLAHAGPVRVCVCVLLLAGSGRAASWARSGAPDPFSFADLGALLVCSPPSGLGLPCLWLLLHFFCAPTFSLAFPVFRPWVPWALASCTPPPPLLLFPFFCTIFAPPFFFFCCVGSFFFRVPRCAVCSVLGWFVCRGLWGVLVCFVVGAVHRRWPVCACVVPFRAPCLLPALCVSLFVVLRVSIGAVVAAFSFPVLPLLPCFCGLPSVLVLRWRLSSAVALGCCCGVARLRRVSSCCFAWGWCALCSSLWCGALPLFWGVVWFARPPPPQCAARGFFLLVGCVLAAPPPDWFWCPVLCVVEWCCRLWCVFCFAPRCAACLCRVSFLHRVIRRGVVLGLPVLFLFCVAVLRCCVLCLFFFPVVPCLCSVLRAVSISVVFYHGASCCSAWPVVFCVVACCVWLFAVGPGCPLLSPDWSWWLLLSCSGGVMWCVPGCCAAPCCCALCRPALCCCACCCAVCCFVLLCLVLLHAVSCPRALSVILGSCAFRRCVLCFLPALCVFCRCVLLCAVVRRCALCRVRPGVFCCAFPVLSALRGVALQPCSPLVPCTPVLCPVVLCCRVVHLGFYGVQKSEKTSYRQKCYFFCQIIPERAYFAQLAPPPPAPFKFGLSQPLDRQWRLDSI